MRKFTSSPKRSLPLIIGRKPLLEALDSGAAIEKIFLLRSATGTDIAEIKQKAHKRNIALSLVPQEKLNQLTRVPNQGVVAYAGLLNYVDLQDALNFVIDKGESPLFLLLDGLTDVRNVGAIARTAWCCGAHGLIFPASNSASLTEEAIKTSAGALPKLLLSRVPSAQQALDILQLNGVRVLATEMKGSVPIAECNMRVPVAVVMGSEEKGVSSQVIKRADELIHIPMQNAFDSLNVSVAAGIILYEAMKQRFSVSTQS